MYLVNCHRNSLSVLCGDCHRNPRRVISLGRVMAVRSLCTASLLLSLSSCAYDRAAKTAVTPISVADLVQRRFEYDGKRVSVTGYLVSVYAGVQLLSPESSECYGRDEGGPYITTTLPESILGEKVPGQWFTANEGRLATVTGVFRASKSPWRRNAIIEPPPSLAAGPLERAQVISVGSGRCALRRR